jgi:hypothetical protein
VRIALLLLERVHTTGRQAPVLPRCCRVGHSPVVYSEDMGNTFSLNGFSIGSILRVSASK